MPWSGGRVRRVRTDLLETWMGPDGALAGGGPEVHTMKGPDHVVRSPSMPEVLKRIAVVAPTGATVLLEGEPGPGKEMVARAIHANGPRRDGPFVAVDCAAVPEDLLESELFGHEKGGSPGVGAPRIGRFEKAAGGTLFLDEVARTGPTVQAKLLRALRERTIERAGGTAPLPVDVRVIAATGRDLRKEIAAGTFREDLLLLLAAVTIRLPSFRERNGDLDLLRAEDAPREIRDAAGTGEEAPAAPGTLAEAEARHIRRVLATTGGRIEAAAKILGIHRNTLARKIRQYGI